MLALLLCGTSLAWGAEKIAPVVKLPLVTLGVPAISTSFLDVGSSMLTIHLLDDAHLLVTFSERKLVPRIVGDPPEDDDRLVAGEVVEIPSGRVLARTEWHMHDHARYLWSLGHGRFLVRIGDSLSTMAPLAKLGEADPFGRVAFPGRGVRPSAIFVSEDGGLVTVEAQVVPKAKGQTRIDVGDTVTVRPDVSTLMDFFRVSGDGSETAPVEVKAVGSVRSPQPFYLPLDSRGYLWPVEVGNNRWALTFDDMQGKTARLGDLQSSCTPRLEMVSHSEFIAMTCRGQDDRVRMASYGLDAQETWQEDFGDFGPPVFGYAPAAGRFALSRKLADAVTPQISQGVGGPAPTAGPAPVERQEVRVYQTASGNLLLKIDCFPALKTAENFSLAEDGTELAVIREGAVEVFKLPALTAHDKEDLEDVAKFSPPEDKGPVVLGLLTGRPTTAREERVKNPREKVDAATATELKTEPPPTLADLSESVAAAATAAAPAVRKPPTLLNPGERAEFGGSKGLNEQPEQVGAKGSKEPD